MRREAPYFAMALGLAISSLMVVSSKYFFLAPAVPLSIIALFVLYRFPEYGLLTFIFFIPLEGLFAGNSLFTGPKLIGIALIAIVSIRILWKQIPMSNLRNPIWYPVLFLVLAFGISTILSPHPSISLQSFKQLLTGISVFYITLAIKDQVNPLQFARVIVISVGITALIALAAGDNTKESRAVGLLTDPNYFALLLTFAAPFAIYLVLYEKILVIRLFWSVLLILLMVSFEKTLSRSGLVVLVLVIGILALHYKAHLRNFNVAQITLMLTGVGLLAATLIFLAPQEYRDRIVSLTNLSSGVHTFEDRSLGRRSSYIVVALEEFKKNPILGAGPGIFPLRYAESGYAAAFSLSKNEPELFRRAHNTYLETLAETGILGLFSLCGIIWVGLRQLRLGIRLQLRSGRGRQAAFTAHFFAAFCAIVLFFLFLTGINNKYFWILLALSGCFSYSKSTSATKGMTMKKVRA